MLLMHISDIHFRVPDCVNPALDPERPYRTRMLQDARARTETFGSVDAILIGGDIAFKGHPQEYEAALSWFKELADAVGCPHERLFVIPGNHDVDREVITRSPSTRNVQQAIAQAETGSRERELRTQFNDSDAARALLAPLVAYNDFAKFFNCQVYPPDHLYWKQDIPLEGGVHLRIHGLTSTLLSGADGMDSNPGKLYLSPLQTVLDPVDDVVNLVLCHHPPDWFLDNDLVDETICSRAIIHLFGHKHRQRVTQEAHYMRFAAGAVNPDRNEHNWKPGYNLIRLAIAGSGPSRTIEIEAQVLEWQANPELYRLVQTRRGEDVFRHRISIPGRVPKAETTIMPSAVTRNEPEVVNTAEADVEATMSTENTRNLIFRFWNLTGSQRREITLKLKLITEDELKLAEPERYGRAILRAGERGQLDALAHEIAVLEIR